MFAGPRTLASEEQSFDQQYLALLAELPTSKPPTRLVEQLESAIRGAGSKCFTRACEQRPFFDCVVCSVSAPRGRIRTGGLRDAL